MFLTKNCKTEPSSLGMRMGNYRKKQRKPEGRDGWQAGGTATSGALK